MSRAFIAKAKALAHYLGEPFADRVPTDVSALVEEFYLLPDNGAGGRLHIVLDDGNVEVQHVEYCREQARKARDEAVFWMAQVLLMLTHEEREAI